MRGWKVKTKTLVLGLAVVCAPVLGTLSTDAVAYLDQLPEKKVTLDLVLLSAVKVSDSFKMVSAASATLEVPALQAKVPLDTRVYTKGNHLDDRREPQSPFMPNSTRNTSVAVGATTLFSTGTALNAEISHGSTTLGFATNPGASFFETRGTLSVSQNLWQDAFGYGTRRAIAAGELSREASEMNLKDAVDEWTLGIVQVFYGAWLAQAQAVAATSNVLRKERLVQNTQLRLNRGTAETPDLLQVQNSLLSAQVQRDQATQILGNRWRELRAAIKLPENLAGVDPVDIPIKLDEPVESMLAVCGPTSALTSAPKHSPSTRKSELQAQAAALSEERAKNALAPDLEVQGGIMANAIDNNRGTTFRETFGYNHPGWSLGVQLSLPLHRYAEEASARVAVQDRLRADAMAGLARDRLQLDWTNYCLDLHRIKDARDRMASALQNQTRRVKLENTRFGVGRSSTFAVVQAEDEATTAELSLLNTESQLRLAAWQVRRLHEGFEPYLKQIQAKFAPSAAEPTPQ